MACACGLASVSEYLCGGYFEWFDWNRSMWNLIMEFCNAAHSLIEPFDWKRWPFYYLLIDVFLFNFDRKEHSLSACAEHCLLSSGNKKWKVGYLTFYFGRNAFIECDAGSATAASVHIHALSSESHSESQCKYFHCVSFHSILFSKTQRERETIRTFIFIFTSLKIPLTFHVQITNIPRIWKLFYSYVCVFVFLFRFCYWLNCTAVLFYTFQRKELTVRLKTRVNCSTAFFYFFVSLQVFLLCGGSNTYELHCDFHSV